MTFAEWDRAADGVAGLLAAHGVARGSVVCLLLPSSIDYMVCYAAAARLGAVTSGINLRLGEPPRSAPSSTAPGRRSPWWRTRSPGPTGGPDGRGTRAVDRCGEAADGPAPDAVARLERTDPVAVVWTSGTTGLPKGAVFDHASLAAVAAGTDVLSAPGDRRLSPLPFAHVGSMTRPWDEIAHGVTTVITPTPWRAADAVRIMAEERITVAQGVPTQWALVLAQPDLDAADLSSLRIAGTGASRVPAELVAAMRRAAGGPGRGPLHLDRGVARHRHRARRPRRGGGHHGGPAGARRGAGRGRRRRPDPSRPGRWAGSASARRRSCAATGVARRRLRAPAAWSTTGRPPPPCWTTTGGSPPATSASLDPAGYLHLVGRANELYIRGGYNVYPAEVEGVLGGHPAVAQVAVVGAPDPVLGEIGVAFVVPDRRGGPPTRATCWPSCGTWPGPPWPTTRPPTAWSWSTPSPSPR